MANRRITRAQFSAQCSYIAKNAASRAAGELDFPEKINKPANVDAVGRFTDGMREHLDLIDKMAGRKTGQDVVVSFLHRLIENAFSWALRDCNYLNPKYMDRLIADTNGGMKPEQAATWRADAPEIATAKAKGETDGNG